MKISTKGRYALRMMLDLAVHQDEGYVSLKEIAERQGISKKYLEQIVLLLNRTGMLCTNRGYQGGYRLAKTPKEYTVGEILQLTEGDLSPVSCLQGETVHCERADSCITLPIWKNLYRVINDYLNNITLQDVLDQAPEHSGVFYI
ncbi:MAG: RrF2 family transcriptional regulator [Oscillospiraceae bacterium]|nr:RrF2 family transcriptional regulator [Oscillospiraceae bacterium]